jgi:hypothetical protein
MAVWKLKPINLNHRDWEASTYRGEVFVRATSEKRSRQIATSAFRIATGVTLGEKIHLDPWIQPDLVSAVQVSDENYLNAGKEEIVGPQEALGYIDA